MCAKSSTVSGFKRLYNPESSLLCNNNEKKTTYLTSACSTYILPFRKFLQGQTNYFSSLSMVMVGPSVFILPFVISRFWTFFFVVYLLLRLGWHLKTVILLFVYHYNVPLVLSHPFLQLISGLLTLHLSNNLNIIKRMLIYCNKINTYVILIIIIVNNHQINNYVYLSLKVIKKYSVIFHI